MPVKTRNNSKSQERKNSVSEITEYFQSVHDKSASGSATSNTTPEQSVNLKIKEKDKSSLNKSKSAKLVQRTNMPTQEIEEATPSLSAISAVSNSSSEKVNHDKEIETFENQKINPSQIDYQSDSDKEEIAVASNAKDKVDATTQTMEDKILNSLNEMQQKLQKLDDDIHMPRNGISELLAKANEKVTNLHSDIHGQVNGILTRLDSISQTATDNAEKIKKMETAQQRMSILLDENRKLVKELQLMKDLVQKLSQQNQVTSSQMLDLTKRGMEQNLIIHGIDDSLEVNDAKEKEQRYTFKERCQYSALDFFKNVMNVDIEVADIWKAHCIGPFKQGKVRPMVLKLSYSAKDLVMEHMGELKGKKNSKTQQVYFISEQIPEGVLETRKQTNARAKILRDANDKLPKEEKKKIVVLQDKILIDGELDQIPVLPPQPSQLFPDSTTQSRIDALQEKMVETRPQTARNSEFIGLALKVHSIQQMNEAYVATAQRFPTADHIVAAYVFKEDGKLKHGACDDREYGASIKVKDCIFETASKNTAVFIVRKYGGVHLGYERFKIIQDVAKTALNLLADSL